jgi:integrase
MNYPGKNSRKQATALITGLNEPFASIVEFAVYSGFRRENILSLGIDQIVFHDLTETGEIELVVKFGRKETFPIGKHAVRVLKRVIDQRTFGYVFLNPRRGTRYTTIHKSFDKSVRKLGLKVNGEKLRFHDLRHLYSTWLHREGVSLDVLRELLGHRNRSTTDRYACLYRKEAGKFLDVMPEIRKRAV